MALPIAIGRQKAGCSLPPTSLLPSHVYSPGFQLCSHFSLGKELSAIVTYTKGLSSCFASLAQRRLRPFKTKEGTVLCLRPMKQCVGRSPGGAKIFLSCPTLSLSDCILQRCSNHHNPPVRPRYVPATKVWALWGREQLSCLNSQG